MMAGTDYHCPNCGAELRGDMRNGGSRAGGTPGCPYDRLAYAALRAGHDGIYFGAWRRIDAPDPAAIEAQVMIPQAEDPFLRPRIQRQSKRKS